MANLPFLAIRRPHWRTSGPCTTFVESVSHSLSTNTSRMLKVIGLWQFLLVLNPVAGLLSAPMYNALLQRYPALILYQLVPCYLLYASFETVLGHTANLLHVRIYHPGGAGLLIQLSCSYHLMLPTATRTRAEDKTREESARNDKKGAKCEDLQSCRS